MKKVNSPLDTKNFTFAKGQALISIKLVEKSQSKELAYKAAHIRKFNGSKGGFNLTQHIAHCDKNYLVITVENKF